MVLSNFFALYFPTGNCRMVKPRKLKPTFPLHSSLASRVWANRVFVSLSSRPMPLRHSWRASLHRWMPSQVLWRTTKSSASLIQYVRWVNFLPFTGCVPGPPACCTTSSRPGSAMVAQRGEATPPCGVPPSVGLNTSLSTTPALSHSLRGRAKCGLVCLFSRRAA